MFPFDKVALFLLGLQAEKSNQIAVAEKCTKGTHPRTLCLSKKLPISPCDFQSDHQELYSKCHKKSPEDGQSTSSSTAREPQRRYIDNSNQNRRQESHQRQEEINPKPKTFTHHYSTPSPRGNSTHISISSMRSQLEH
jgi:hypothetical protein